MSGKEYQLEKGECSTCHNPVEGLRGENDACFSTYCNHCQRWLLEDEIDWKEKK